jgi:hypothetical protein
VQQANYASEGAGFSRAALVSRKEGVQDTPVAVDRSQLARVVWLGVASTVSKEELDGRFPRTASLSPQGADAVFQKLDKEMEARFQQGDFQPSGFQLVPFAQQQPTDYALALLVNKERWRQELLFDGKWRWEYSIYGQLVFIDQQKQEICSSFPVALRTADAGDSPPTSEQTSRMVVSGLFGATDDPSGDKSLYGNCLAVLRNQAVKVRPDYCFEALEVEMAPGCAQPAILQTQTPHVQGAMGAVQYADDELVNFAGDTGALFVSHLGNGTHLPVHPYVKTRQGRENILALQFCGGKARILNTMGKLSLKLRPPVRQFSIRIEQLNCEVDPEWSGKYAVNILFGFQGMLEVIEPVTQRKVLEHRFDLSLAGIKQLPKALQEPYWQLARRKLLPEQFANNQYDSKWCWSNAMDSFLEQLTAEMLFAKADKAGRFQVLREDLSQIHPALGAR